MSSDELGLLLLAVLFEKIFEEGRCVEVIFDGTFAAAGDDDDVARCRGYATLPRRIGSAAYQRTASISLGCALVAGRNRVPKPAAGKTAFLTLRAEVEVRRRLRVVVVISF